MANGDVALQIVRGEVDRSIEVIEAAPVDGTCPMCSALANGVLTLLRCKRAEMDGHTAAAKLTRETAAQFIIRVAAPLAAGAVGVIVGKVFV